MSGDLREEADSLIGKNVVKGIDIYGNVTSGMVVGVDTKATHNSARGIYLIVRADDTSNLKAGTVHAFINYQTERNAISWE